jgi:hypothetical protein
LTGRRIVDINHLFLTLKSIKHQGFDCSFYDVDIINEKRYGLKSYFSYKCTICGLEGTFSSEPDTDSSEINKSAVCGIIAMGAGFTQFSYLSAALDIPCMSSSKYFAVENQVLNNVKEVAINEMIDAGQEELRLALEAGEVDSNGVGMITVIVDGAWSKRSYKTNYNALSGVASISGARLKKVLYIGIQNKYCRICEKFAKLKKKHHHINVLKIGKAHQHQWKQLLF